MDDQYLYDSEYLEWCSDREQEFIFQIDEEIEENYMEEGFLHA